MLEKIKNSGQVPNALSTIRLLLFWVPTWILISTPADSWAWRGTALLVFAAIVATDSLDGYLARRWQQISNYGKVVDPLADKALVLATLSGICLTAPLFNNWYGWVLVGVLFLRELSVVVLRCIRSKQNLIIPANKDGKAKMILQSLGLTLAFLPHPVFAVVAWGAFLSSMWFAWQAAKAYTHVGKK